MMSGNVVIGGARQLLSIRSTYRGQAFRVIEEVLRNDPVLAVQVKTWRSLEGLDEDLQMPTPDMMPFVGLSPVPYPNMSLSVDETKINFAMSIQLFTAGTCVDDILALWEAFEDAILITKIFHGVPLQQYLCPVIQVPDGTTRTIMNLRPRAPAFIKTDYRSKANDPSCLFGEGFFVAQINRPR